MTVELTTLWQRPDGSSPITCRTSRPCRSGCGSAPARATRRSASTASRTSSSTWPSRAPSRRSAQQIAEEIEEVGGELNAATSMETTAYFARVLKGDDGVGARTSSPTSCRTPRFGQDELERERQVILQEIAATRDSPDDIGYDLLQDAAFPNKPVGRPILGTAAERQQLPCRRPETFLGRRYGPGNMVIVRRRRVRHANVVRHAEALFGGLTDERRTTGERPAKYVGGVRVSAEAFRAKPSPDRLSRSLVQGRCVLHGPGVLGAVRRGHVVPAVPGGAGEARPLLRDLFDRWGLPIPGLFGIHAATGTEMMGKLDRRRRRRS